TSDLLGVLGYTTGVETNDTTFQGTFPYVQMPWRGTGKCGGLEYNYTQPSVLGPSVGIGLSAPEIFVSAGPNPFADLTAIRYRLRSPMQIDISIYDLEGRRITTLVSDEQVPGEYTLPWEAADYPAGVYIARVSQIDVSGNMQTQSIKLVKSE
ncbi:MAG: T9SS type A sorting domain-containing protein, partial [Bacteroidota bacterium]